jgi:hypothetical protein
MIVALHIIPDKYVQRDSAWHAIPVYGNRLSGFSKLTDG